MIFCSHRQQDDQRQWWRRCTNLLLSKLLFVVRRQTDVYTKSVCRAIGWFSALASTKTSLLVPRLSRSGIDSDSETRRVEFMISCRKLASIQLHISLCPEKRRCIAIVIDRNHFYSSPSREVFFSVKIIKRNLSHSSFLLILNLWLSASRFANAHLSHFSNSRRAHKKSL